MAILIIIEIVMIRSASGTGTSIDALFAKQDISVNSLLTAEMLEVRKVDSKALASSALKSPEEAVGKRTAGAIAAGQIIYSGSLNGDPGNASQFESPDNRLFSLELKGDAANGWWIGGDQRIDVIFIPGSDKAVDKTGVSGLGEKLENIRVAAVLDEKGNRIGDAAREAIPKYICLEVTPEQSMFLAFAKTNGKIELAVRPDSE